MERRWIEEVPGIREDPRVHSGTSRRPCLNDNQRNEIDTHAGESGAWNRSIEISNRCTML